MTDDRAEKLAHVFAAPGEPGRIDRLYAEAALAAVDADPETYGYTRCRLIDKGCYWYEEHPIPMEPNR